MAKKKKETQMEGHESTEAQIENNEAPVAQVTKTRKKRVDEEGYLLKDGQRVLDEAGNPIKAPERTLGAPAIAKMIRGKCDEINLLIKQGKIKGLEIELSLDLSDEDRALKVTRAVAAF